MPTDHQRALWREQQRRRRAAGKKRHDNLLFRYRMTTAQFEARLAAQGGRCADCGSTDPMTSKGWHVDHDHACCPPGGRTCGGCVRAVLCLPCNLALGRKERSLVSA